MSDDVANQLWTEVATKSFVMEIIEEIAHIFIGKDTEGGKTRYISVQDVVFEGKQINDVLHIEASAKLLSDQGSWNQPMILRIHKNLSRFNSERRLYDVLVDRTSKFEDIHPTKLIYLNPQQLLMVYESIASDLLLNLDPLLIDFSLGRIASVMHGKDVNNYRVENLINNIIYILEYLPFPEDISKSLKELLTQKAEKVPFTQSAFLPCTAFTPSLLKIKYRTSNPSSIDLFTVAKGKGFDTYIPMGVVDEDFHDRFEDIANFYAIDAFEEYIRTGKIEETKERIERFLTGYNMISQNSFHLELEKFYPVGYILDLQLILSIWLQEVSSINISNPDYERINQLGMFSIHLLSEGVLDEFQIETF